MPEGRAAGPPDSADCCRAVDPRIARHFDRRMQERTADGSLPELHSVSRRLFEALLDDVEGSAPSILEIGCGSGALTVALLEHGAATSTGVDLSADSLEVARRRADAAGMSGRARFEQGDGASAALERHDWVILDRVLCCYPELDHLLDNSVSAAGRRYAFSVPASGGWRGRLNRILFRLEEAIESIRGMPCPGYVHDISKIEGRLTSAGFRRTGGGPVGMWYVAVFDRA
jgi:SAM-dependent methyltransferase